MYLKELLPTVEEKWPAWCPKVIRLQQDNATPHPPPGKDDMLNHRIAEMASRGWDVQFVCQPPNSPDCNVKDLAFFRAIDAIKDTKIAHTIEELMENVREAYQELPMDTCCKVWTTLQMVMNEIIRAGGDNTYKLPHAGKDRIIRQLNADIPHVLPCQAR